MADPTEVDPYDQAADALAAQQPTSTPPLQAPRAPSVTPPVEQPDPFEEAAGRMKDAQERERQLQSKLLQYRAANDTADPGKRAEVLSLSAATGLGPDLVERNLDDVREKVKAAHVNWDAVTYRQPGLVRMLQAEPQLMPLVQDDTANLHGIEWALGPRWSVLGVLGGDIFNGGPGHALRDALGEQAFVIPRQFVQATPKALETLAGDAEDIGLIHVSKEDKIAALRRANAEAIREAQGKYSNKDYGDTGGLSSAVVATARMLPMILADMAARAAGGAVGSFFGGGAGAAEGGVATAPIGGEGAVPGGLLGGVGGGALGQFAGSGVFNYYEAVGPAYERFSQMKGADGNPLDPALVQAVTQATAISSGMLMAAGSQLVHTGVGSLAKPVMARFAADAIERAMVQPGVAGIMKRGLAEFGKDWLVGATLMGAQGMVNQVAVEGAQTAANQHLELKDVLDNPNAFALDVAAQGNLDRVVGAGAHGFVGGLKDMWLLSLAGAGKGVLAELGRSRTSAENAHRYDALMKAAAESKLLERSPDVFERAVREMKSDVPNVMVPFERWVEYWQGQKSDPAKVAADVVGDGGAEYAKAASSRGDIAIPTEKFTRYFSKTPHAEGLAQDVKLKPDDLTPRQFKEQQEDYQRRVKELVKRNPDFEADRAEVRKFIRDMAVAAGHSREEANANAKLTEDFVTALAVKGNISIREAARQANLGQLRIVGPKGEKALAAARERFAAFLTPRAEEYLAKRLESMSPEQRAQEAYIDKVSGLREREIFDQTKVPEGKQVAIITSPDVKGINEHPTHGGHGITDEMLRVMGAAIGEKHPEAAREGTSFLVHVSSDAELRDLVEKARKALGNENLQPLVSATGSDSEAAFKALDKETARRRGELKPVEGEPPPLPVKSEDRLLERGKLNPKLDVGSFGEALKSNPARGKATVPPEFVEKMRGLTNEQYRKQAYADHVEVDGKKQPTGLLSRNGWDAIPRKRHAVMIDLKGLKAANKLGEELGLGKELGNQFLHAFGDLMAHIGGSSFDAAHLSGDEYALQHDDRAELERFVERVKKRTDRLHVVAENPDSGETRAVPIDFRHGIGTDLIEADRDLSTRKAAEGKVAAEDLRQGDGTGGVAGGQVARGEPRQSTEVERQSRGRGAARFFQRDVVDYIEGQPVVFRSGETTPPAKTLEQVVDSARSSGLVLDVSENADWINLNRIVVPKDERGQGVGTKAMRQLTAYADRVGKPIALSPTAELGATSKGRLVEFYGRFGFVENKGRNKDFTTREAMIRQPREPGTKYKQFPRPEQSLEELERERVFTDTAIANGAKVVDSVDALVDQMKRVVESFPEAGRKAPRFYVQLQESPPRWNQQRLDTFEEAERFIRKSEAEGKRVSFVHAEMTPERLRLPRSRAEEAASYQNMLERQKLGIDVREGDEFGPSLKPDLEMDAHGRARGQYIIDPVTGERHLSDKIPDSENLPGQAEAEAAPRPAQAIAAENVAPENYTGMVVLKSSGREPGERARGSISLQLDPTGKPRSFAITAFAGDKSTLMHETAHFLSWSFHDIAESDLATQQMKDDYAALLKWAGFKGTKDRLFQSKEVEALQERGELTPSEQRRLREKQAPEERIAHGFEQYLLEGKAPNSGLARVFSKFREWLLKIYGGLEGIQQQYRSNYGEDINLSNEVRDIFSRLLGQEDALNQARAATGETVEGPRPPPLPTAGMTPEEREAYFAADAAAKIHGEQEVARRMAELQGEQTEDIRSQVSQGVAKDLDSTTTYRAQRYLQLGELVDQQGNVLRNIPDVLLDEKGRTFRLDRKTFVKEFGKDVAALMPRGIWGKDGKKADEVAPLLGFQDGSEMVDAFRAVPPRDRALAQETQAKLNEIYGPAQQAVAKAALSAVHSEASTLKTLIQLRALARQVDPAAEARINAVDPRVMKATAERLINEQGVGDLSPEQYVAAERKAAIEAARLEGKGDKRGAIEQKLGRLFNQMLFRAARDAADKTERMQSKLEKTSELTRSSLGKADPSYRDVHDAIIHAVGLGPEPSADALGLDVMLQKMTTDGHDPAEAFDVDGIKKVLEGKYDWDQLSVAEATNVADAIKYIRHIADKALVIELGSRRWGRDAFNRAVAERTASIQKPQPPMPYSRTAETRRQKARRLRINAQSLFEDVETWAEMMDGGTKGPVHDLLINSYTDCRAVENELIRSVLKPIKEAWENVPKDVQKLKSRIVDVKDLLPVKSDTLAPIFTRDTLWALFLNYSSEGNRQRLNDGNGWTNENMEKALSVLTEPELDFLQTVKNTINGLYPELAEAYEKRTGLKLGKVDALPVTINGKAYAGGYHPVRFDSRRSRQGEQQEANDVKALQGSTYQRPTLPNSATKKRVEKVNAPVDLSWGVVPAHLSQVIRDISYGEWVRTAGSVMLGKQSNEPSAPPTWKDTTTKFLGEERARRFVPWLQDVTNARADSAAANQSDVLRIIGNGARSTMARVAMGFNFPSLTRHMFDPYSAIADTDSVAPHRIAAAYVRVMNPANWNRAEYAASKELANHEAKLHDNLRETLANIGPNEQSKLGRILTSVAFYAHGLVHHFTSRVGFTAAYEQALADGATKDEAIQAADDIVRRHFPSGDIHEKPPILRTKYGAAAAVMYYGYAAKMHNVRARAFDALARAYEGPNTTPMDAVTATAKFAGKWLALGAVSAMGTYFAGRAWKKKDDTIKGAAEWVAEEIALDPVDGLPFGLGAAIKKIATGAIHKDWGHEIDISNSPELALAEDAFNRIQRLIQKAQGSGHTSDVEKLWAAVEIIATAMAGAEGNRVIGNYNAQRKGEFRPKGALGQAEGAFYGAPKKEEGESAVNPLHHIQKALGR